MKNLLKPAILLVAMALTFTSCKKDDDNQNSNNNNNSTPTPTGSKTQLLTAGPWRLTSELETSVSGNYEFFPEDYLPCELDDLLRFNANLTGSFDGAQNECEPGYDDYSFDWSWSSNETILTVDGDEYVLVDLTSTTLKLKEVYLDWTVQYTFIRQ
jgi:hypothetical protein